MRHGVAEEVREQLRYPGAVAINNFGQRNLDFHYPVGMRRLQLLYHLIEGRPNWLACSPLQRQAPAKTPPCKIEHVINKPSHSRGALLNAGDDVGSSIRASEEHRRTGGNRHQRIAQIVTQDRNELDRKSVV